jgi:molybdate transport system substrate-binding protein
VVASLGLIAVSCGDDNPSSSNTAGPTTEAATTPAASTVAGDVTVFAASSLTAAYTEVGDAFKTSNPDANVVFNFASSSDLVTQITEGAAADVYASADTANMKKLTDAGGNAAEPQVFATNSLQIIVQPGNPKGIETLADLDDPGLIYVTCAPEVPIGKYAQQALDSAGVVVTPASLEENVKGIVTKVALGEADAGIVYTTDVIAAGDKAEGVDIPEQNNVIATYPVAVTQAAPNPDGAQAFVDFVLSDEGQQILARYGFTSP